MKKVVKPGTRRVNGLSKNLIATKFQCGTCKCIFWDNDVDSFEKGEIELRDNYYDFAIFASCPECNSAAREETSWTRIYTSCEESKSKQFIKWLMMLGAAMLILGVVLLCIRNHSTLIIVLIASGAVTSFVGVYIHYRHKTDDKNRKEYEKHMLKDSNDGGYR
ncbi:MAG: hypothetical protein FWC20_00645 [Oscillospiraceae bacterium]|nr:hypothetical protein [Oscillospiraceae bacterium]MCL2277901.1 hypothetical protein [Oscillospiraceae bacterium]